MEKCETTSGTLCRTFQGPSTQHRSRDDCDDDTELFPATSPPPIVPRDEITACGETPHSDHPEISPPPSVVDPPSHCSLGAAAAGGG